MSSSEQRDMLSSTSPHLVHSPMYITHPGLSLSPFFTSANSTSTSFSNFLPHLGQFVIMCIRLLKIPPHSLFASISSNSSLFKSFTSFPGGNDVVQTIAEPDNALFIRRVARSPASSPSKQSINSFIPVSFNC